MHLGHRPPDAWSSSSLSEFPNFNRRGLFESTYEKPESPKGARTKTSKRLLETPKGTCIYDMPPSAAYQRARSGHALTAILLPPCEVQPNSTNPTRFPHRGGQLAGKPIKHDQLSISCAVGVGRWPLPTEIGTRDSNRDSKFTPLERRHTDRTEMSYFEHRLVSPACEHCRLHS